LNDFVAWGDLIHDLQLKTERFEHVVVAVLLKFVTLPLDQFSHVVKAEL
jgi:hypothetical protein